MGFEECNSLLANLGCWWGRHVGLRGPTFSQVVQEETLSGPDRHQTGQGPHGHLFINWTLDQCWYCSP